MLSIWNRELKQYFFTATGYVFLTVFWLLSAVFFFLYNILSGSSDLSEMFGSFSYLFMLLVPLLTMRLLSTERAQKTDQLYCCTPVTLTAVALGKFLAAATVLLIGICGTGVYVVLLTRYADVQAGRVFSCIIGFFLLGSAYIGIGLLMSSLTDSQITAAVLTFAANMLLQLAELSAPTLHVPYLAFLPRLLGAFTLNARYARFVSGLFSPADIGYFLTFTAITLLLTVAVLNRRRMKPLFSGRSVKR